MSAEFDGYAADYAELLRDPLRDRFASTTFFYRRKWELIREFWRGEGAGLSSLDWLDIGCGQGDLLRLGAGEVRSAAGCDPSAEMLRPFPGVTLRRQQMAEELPFETASFDFATLVCVYHHVEEYGRVALTVDAARVLRSGGVLAIIEHNPWNPITQAVVRRTPVDATAHLMTARRSRELARVAGMQVVETRYFLYLPERLYRSAAPLEGVLSRVPMGGQYAVFARKL